MDNVYTPELIMEQYDYHGTLVNGFINSIFGQRDVTVTTQGSNYIALNDDVYMYTGVTSANADQSNLGFLLSNQRTKETKFYTAPGATEKAAQASAMGVVQRSWVYSHLPPAAQYRWRAHLLHPPEGQYQPGQELRHGQCGPIPDRGHRLHRLRV